MKNEAEISSSEKLAEHKEIVPLGVLLSERVKKYPIDEYGPTSAWWTGSDPPRDDPDT
jgi:hypothetical protein